MKQFLLYGHGGAYNHGAEAIVKSTVELLKKEFPDSKILLSTHFKEQDLEFCLPVDHYCERDISYVKSCINTDENYGRLIYRPTLDCITQDTVCLSIGGDNYCYDNWRKWKVIHETALDRGAFTVLWGCSIEPAMIDEEMEMILGSHHLITARECITANILQGKGLKNVYPCADTAFLLKSTPCKLPPEFLPGNTVALNISPLILRREQQPGIIMENIKQLVRAIITETNMNLVLIPHVLMPVDNDLWPLREIYQNIPEKHRVSIIEQNLSAAEYKYIISQCRFGIFSRTHASIAAYASFVPSMVLGYSVKSKGIAADLGLEDYVLPVNEIKDNTRVLMGFQSMQNQESEIHNLLLKKIPMYNKKAVVSLKSIIESI